MKQFNPKLCPVCKLYFVPKTGSAVYCGRKCREEGTKINLAKREIERLTRKKRKNNHLSIAEIQRIGRKHNMTYGEAVAAIERGDIKV